MSLGSSSLINNWCWLFLLGEAVYVEIRYTRRNFVAGSRWLQTPRVDCQMNEVQRVSRLLFVSHEIGASCEQAPPPPPPYKILDLQFQPIGDDIFARGCLQIRPTLRSISLSTFPFADGKLLGHHRRRSPIRIEEGLQTTDRPGDLGAQLHDPQAPTNDSPLDLPALWGKSLISSPYTCKWMVLGEGKGGERWILCPNSRGLLFHLLSCADRMCRQRPMNCFAYFCALKMSRASCLGTLSFWVS